MTGFYNMYFSAETYRILIVGEEKSGKTVIQSLKIIFYFIFRLDKKRLINFYLNVFIKKTYFEHLKQKLTGRGTPLNSIIPTTGLNRKKIINFSQFPN